MRTIQSIREADEFFASLPDGFDSPQDFAAALPAGADPAIQYIPVAGTAGKTAVASLTAGILTGAGFRTGLYTAGAEPLSVRILVDGQPLDGAAAEAYTEAADRILEGTLLSRPAAELAAACSCFGAVGCAFAVVETADGALASALPQVPACAVTHIGPDGTGRTIERLAHDAAAVMRKGTVCVTAPGQPKPALTEIIVAAGKVDCELVVPDEEDITFPDDDKPTARVDYGGYDVPPAFMGYHAACNAAVAVELALALWRKGHDIQDDAILGAMAAAKNRSSIRIVSRDPLVILDACRTPQQAAALLRVLQMAKIRHLNAVIGLRSQEGAEDFFATLENGLLTDDQKKDKEKMPGMGEEGPIDRLYLTAPAGSEPALADTLTNLARFHFEAQACASLEEALEAARAAGGRGIVICGSQELALEAERLLESR